MIMELPENLKFIKSVAFWVVVFNAVIFYLQQKGIVGQDELVLVTAIAAPFVVINQTRKAAKDIGARVPSVSEIEDGE